MGKTFLKTPQYTQQLWQKPAWYQALTLTERTISLQAGDKATQGISNIEKARRKLQRWKEQAPFDRSPFFVKRLSMDSITEDDLLTLLAEPNEAIQARMTTSGPPDWLVELTQAFEDHITSDDVQFPMQEAGDSQSVIDFLKPIQSLLKRGLARLQAGIDALSEKHTHLPFEPKTVASALFANLPQQLLPKLSRTLVLEMNVARLRGHLQGETAKERFEDFVQQLSKEGGILPLLKEYPVLARQLVVTIDLWVTASLEFLRHLCADWEEICIVFTPKSNPGTLIEIKGGAGDTHRGGRSVIILTFSSGLQLVYKPKSLVIDVHFQELLTWLNDRGQHPAFRTLKLIDKGTYGWSEFISASECTSEEEVRRFYERQGAFLALLYALEATDFHAENVIAAGEYPMLIDLEGLFHPRVRKDDLTFPEHPALRIFTHSVLRIGLLPQRIWSYGEAAGVDISGLGGQEGQLTPRPVPQWEGIDTDQMRIVRQQIEITVQNNRPKLNGYAVDALNYRDNLIIGFTRMYRLLIEHRDELIAELLPRFAHDEIRFIARPTRIYGLLLFDSFHPNMLRNALDRDRLFDRLWVGIDRNPYFSSIIPAERADLLKGEIPLFTTHPNGRKLFTSQGEQIAEFFDEPSLDAVRKGIQQLGEDDLARQIWMIQASFTSRLMDHEPGVNKRLQLQSSHLGITQERLVAAGRAVGDHLCDLALRNEDTAGWLSVNQSKGREWRLQPTDTDLYHGTSGIALFLGYLGAVTGEALYIDLTEAALQSVRYMVEQQKNDQNYGAIGAFEGLGSTIYLLSHLGTLWNKPSLFREAERLVEILPNLIEKDDQLDIIAGSAGCIASLLSLHAVAPSARTLAVAVQCGNHLIARARAMKEGVGWIIPQQETPLTGFSHGAAGIAWSLLRLASASREERFRQTAVAAMAYERSLFSPDKRNWPDLREVANTRRRDKASSAEEPHFMNAWCHGAPGIGLGRLGSLRFMDDAVTHEEIVVALKTTIVEGFGRNHSLCHGDFGNLETLLVAAHTLDDSRYQQQVECITAVLLDSIDAQGWVTGVPLGVETPGLMTGLAGIGYEMLRLAYPEKVPSVLLLEPPSFANAVSNGTAIKAKTIN